MNDTKSKDANFVRTSRRSVLKASAALAASPHLLRSSTLLAGLVCTRVAEAQGGTRPDKTLAIYVPGGAIHDAWAPTGAGASMQMKAMSVGYEPVKTQINFLLNMSHAQAGHGRLPQILSNSWSGSNVDTFDVFMGKQLGAGRPFTYVNLGVHSNGQGYLTRDGNVQIPFEDSPFNAFRLLFGSGAGAGSPMSAVLDAHAAAVNEIRAKLAGYEVHRMDEHLDAIADTRDRLQDFSGDDGACSPTPDAAEFPLTYDTFSQQARLQADIAAAALRCGVTSSVSLAFGNHNSQFRIPELDYKGSYHQSIHGGSNGLPNYPYYTEMRAHLGSLTAYAIEALDAAGILDETVVVETTDMGHADLHSGQDVPFMIAGGGAAIRRGVTTPAGPAYDRLDVLYTAAKACGVELPYGREVPGVLT